MTVNEFRRLFDALLLATSHTVTPCWPGHDGADDTNAEHAFPTTDAANINDHDLRLQNLDTPQAPSYALSCDDTPKIRNTGHQHGPCLRFLARPLPLLGDSRNG